MAKRFVRVDLSDVARDFRPIAVEPGVPLLDRSNTNSRILFKWLGGMVAEPEWEGESVNFFARDDHGGRLEDVHPQSASDEDLKGPLKDDVEILRQRIAKAKPETSTERAVHKILTEEFNNVLDNENRTDRPNYFFKYRDAAGRWRLLWCWGYHRVDQEPGPTVVCGADDCNMLFVRRKGQSAKCPSCAAALAPKVEKKAKRRPILTPIVLLLILVGLVYWLLTRNQLIAKPDDWDGPVGGRVAFSVHTYGFLGLFRKDVTRQAVALVEDPGVVRFDRYAGSAVARNPGTTSIRFYLGSKRGAATLTVLPAENPAKLTILPEILELGTGTTARLKLIGAYENGKTADLTEWAEWYPKNDGVVYAFDGFVQGLSPGNSTVGARYRASPGSSYMETSSSVSVSNVSLQDLEVALAPDPVPVGGASRLEINGVTADGKRFSVSESSQLGLTVEPSYLASARGRYLQGEHPGRGRLKVSLGELSREVDFAVERTTDVASLAVSPEQLTVAVGELADVSIVSSGLDPVRMTSSAPGVVEIAPDGRLAGRSEGEATIEVRQGDEARKVSVSVVKADVRAISVVPGLVGVPIDHDVPVAVWGHTEAGRAMELSPDLVACEKSPSPRAAEFVRGTMTLHGVGSTVPDSPEKLAFRFKKLQTEVPVEVVQAPLRLELAPPGPVELPLGQAMEPEAWANYPAGRTIQLSADRLEWQSESPKAARAGLELRGGKVVALEAGGGPMTVWGAYLGRESNRVVFRSVEAGPVDLALEVDRTLRLAGEPGRVVLTGTGPQGDVELVAELAEFSASDAAVLNVDGSTGAFRAVAPGEVTVTAGHVASNGTADVKLRVVDPANARLVFEPNALNVAVDEKATLRLFLEAEEDGQSHRDRMTGPGVRYHIGEPGAIRWHAPELVGLKPAGPFDVTGSYLPYLARPAAAEVEVVAAEKPTAIRVVPGEIAMAGGQTVSLTVQEQLPGSDAWREIRGDAVVWDVPAGVIWEPATEHLRPAITLPHGTSGTLRLVATYRDQQAVATVTTGQPALDPADASVRLVLEREPEGRYVPVGKEQRYRIMLRKGKQWEPAVDVRWPRSFENDYVRWDPPVLTAKRAGFQQWLQADVAGRAKRFYTYTVDPFQPSAEPPRREDQPAEVRIVSDQGPAVSFPVGAEFDDFRIEARYPDGFTRIVTQKATMRTAERATGGPVAFRKGRIVGAAPGQAVVHADFEGVGTTEGLQATVTRDVDIDEIVVNAPQEMLVGETLGVEATGYRQGSSIGKITGLGALELRSDNPQKVSVDGPWITGKSLGQAGVTARLGAVSSPPATVSVVDSIADRLRADEDTIFMRVGESRWIGSDFAVTRGDTDLSRQVRVYSSLPQVVEYDPETHSLRANQIGQSVVTFASGDKTADMTVEVLPGGLADGEVIIEPAVSTLARGQAADLRVYVLDADGYRIDRTDSAVFSSSAQSNVLMMGNRACAVAPGSAEVTATLPETESSGRAAVHVNDEEITDLVIEPSQLVMPVGDFQRINVLGRAAGGTHPLYPQQALEVSAAGPNPEAIRIEGSHVVDAVTPGEAEVAVNWADRLNGRLPVTVTDGEPADLVIDPPVATIQPGRALTYQVTATWGGQRRVLGPADGLQLLVTDPDVAQPAAEGTTVVANSPGRTSVVAEVGGQRAEAVLDVVAGDGPIGTVAGGPGGLVLGDDGYVYGPGGEVVYGPDDLVYGPDGVAYGPGGVVIHRGGTRGYGPGYGRLGYDTWAGGGGYVGDGTAVYAPPAASVARLRFVPDVVRMGTDSPARSLRVVEVLADGTVGRDVTSDPALEFNVLDNVAQIKQSSEAVEVEPVSPGTTRIGARLGDPPLFADPPLLVQVGDYAADAARLAAYPSPLELWTGEAARLDRVMVLPGAGQAPFEVSYSMSPRSGQSVVTVDQDGTLRALAPGETSIVVSAAGAGTAYDGLSTTVPVTVTEPGTIWLEPGDVSLKVSQLTPPFAMMSRDAGGFVRRLPAVLESVDPNVLVPDAHLADRFVARGLGRTQVRGVYRGREVFADVNVTGQRFVDVETTLVEGQDDFSVTLEVLAAKSEGPLEYRAYAAGQSPPESWVPAEPSADYQRTLLKGPRMPYGPRGARYSLIVESRSTTNGSVQQYPFTFRLAPKIVAETP